MVIEPAVRKKVPVMLAPLPPIPGLTLPPCAPDTEKI